MEICKPGTKSLINKNLPKSILVIARVAIDIAKQFELQGDHHFLEDRWRKHVE